MANDTNPLRDMIVALIRHEIAATLSDLDSGVDTIAERASEPRVRAARVVRDGDGDDVPVKRRQSRPRTPNVAYIVQHDVAASDLTAPAMYQDVWAAIRKAQGWDKPGRKRAAEPMSESDIIAATGRKDASAKKAVQSAIWWLRNHNVAGKRVQPGRAAILASERLDRGE